MNLEEKLKLFKYGALTGEEILLSNSLAAHDVRLKSRYTNIFFESNVSFQSTVLPTKDYVFLGAYSYMNEDGYIRGPAFIGRFCSIGRRVSIGAGMHSFAGLSSHPLLSSESVNQYYSEEEIVRLGITEHRPVGVVVGSDVWIGDGAVILPGVNIGEGSIIGANALVNKDISPYSIVAGIPARPLRHRFPPEICLELLKSRWWEYDLDKVKVRNYNNILEFLSSNLISENEVCYPTFTCGVSSG